MTDKFLTRAELWARFAAGTAARRYLTVSETADIADRLLQEFELRWTWDGQDEVWKRRPEAK